MTGLVEILRAHQLTETPTWANERICSCGETVRTMPPGPDYAAHVVAVIAAAKLAIVRLPLRAQIPKYWDESCLGAWSADGREDPISAWPDGVALADGEFITVDKAKATAAALLAAAASAESPSVVGVVEQEPQK